MGTSDDVLKRRCEDTIKQLKDAPQTGVCASHKPLSEGVCLLLEIESAKMDKEEKPQSEGGNYLKYGKLVVHGPAAILAVAVVYTILKLHGIL